MAELQRYPPIASGRFDAWVAVISVNREAIKPLLPGNCDLADQDLSPPGEHPLVILAGTQKDVRSRISPHLRLSYLEAGVMIPWIVCSDVRDSNASLFRASLYLNQSLPIVLGRMLGITKAKGVIARDHFCMQVHTEDDGRVFKARYFPQGTFARPSKLPWFDSIQQLFNQVHVGQALDREPMPTICVFCDLNLSHGYLRPVNAELEFTSDFCPAQCGTIAIPPITSGPFGAFQFQTQWTMQFLS